MRDGSQGCMKKISLKCTSGATIPESRKWRNWFNPVSLALSSLSESPVLAGEYPYDDISAHYVLLPHDLSVVLSLLGTVPPVKKMLCTNAARPETGMIIKLQENGGPEVWIEYATTIPQNKRSYTVVGSSATVQLADSHDTELMFRKGAPGSFSAEKLKVKAEGPLPLLKELSVFVDHIQGGPPPLSPLSEAVQVIERLTEIGDWLAAVNRS